MGFKLKDLGGGIHGENTHTSTSNGGVSQAKQCGDRGSLAVSQEVKQKSNHLRCMYTNAHSLGNNQEELALRAHSEGYDIIGVTETQWAN